jgi:hypothetical protein
MGGPFCRKICYEKASMVDLTCARLFPLTSIANVKSKTTLETYVCECAFGSENS